ncbi:MAG: TIGR04282 family arsenosugar biosynthesis glycosyltransferase [Acidobacteriota bacterium]|nr:TIGR04282 family arsenosugar biosynthesis glycosyltransferase [Acidobacteriota bacterium]MDE2965700.1 TIGR04282 family arsenosugar biosynthesis glycosyltransferase [Acidobacteriota bacterium]
MDRTSLNIFAKAPVLGTVKTRMSPPLSPAQCLRLHRALLDHTLARMRPLVASGVEASLCLTGTLQEALEHAEQMEVRGFGVEVQRGANLGERLSHALTTRFSQGYSRVIFVGTDCPGLGPNTVRDAIRALNRQEVVIGPAQDGGYYLIGFAACLPQILQGIPWGTPAVYATTLDRLRRREVRWKSLERQADLDTFGDLKQFHRRARPGKSPKDGIDPAFFATIEGLILEAGHDF